MRLPIWLTRTAVFASALTIALLASAGVSSAEHRFDYCVHEQAVAHSRGSFVGIGDAYVEIGSERFRDCSFGWMAADHIAYFRGVLTWDGVEYAPGRFSFAYFDRLVADLARHHLRFLPVLNSAPTWASTAPQQGALSGAYPPSNPAQFAQFAAMCVRRYGPRGTFWRENPRLPYVPIRAWQIWNEPNLVVNWEPEPNAGAYAQLLRASYVAIKRVDRHATVVTAGMPFADPQVETSFLSQVLQGGARNAFDALAIHPYAGSAASAIGTLQVARRVLNRFGDKRKPLWVTEVAWAGGGAKAYIANQRGQAQNLVAFFDQVHRDRALRVQKVFWYGWQDKVYGPDPSYWGYHLGLFTTRLRPKLALARLSRIAGRFG